MTVLSQEVPSGVVEWLGDFRWWKRLDYYTDGRSTVVGVPMRDVVSMLRGVYDERACATMVADGRWTPLLGLFVGGFEWTARMLALGVDLVTCPEALEDGELLAGLRGSQWTGARTEIGVWAGLRRAGLDPRRPDLRSDEKQCDFVLNRDGLTVAIECKALSLGNAEGNFQVIEETFQSFTVVTGTERRKDAVLRPSEELHALMRQMTVQDFFSHVRPRFIRELQRVLASASLDGVPHEIGPFGTVTLTPPARALEPFLGEIWTMRSGNDVLDRQRRLIRQFAVAAQNLRTAPFGSHRVAVVWTGKDYVPPTASAAFIGASYGVTVATEALRVSVAPAQLAFETGVVIGAHESPGMPGWDIEHASFQLPEVTPLPEAVVSALSAWQFLARVDK